MQKIVVALTSYPKRINIVHKVVESLWNQSMCADEIILYLSSEEFPRKERDIPIQLINMIGKNGFRVEWSDGNLKSHKKYYYALQKYYNDIVITVDDDTEYAETLISDLFENYQKFSNAILARRARIILRENEHLVPYQEWDTYLDLDEYIASPRMDLCAIGVGGVLYPPHCISKEWFDQEKIVQLAENQDDLWLKYNEIVNDIAVVYVKATQKDRPIDSAEETALSLRNMYNGENDISIYKLCDHMKNYWPTVYSNWFDTIMAKDEYNLKKKKYYFTNIQKLISGIQDAPIFLYGAGKRTKIILSILADCQMIAYIKAIIVSDKKNNPKELAGIEVMQLDEINKSKKFNIIYGVGKKYHSEIEEKLQCYDCRCFDLDIQGIELIYSKSENCSNL